MIAKAVKKTFKETGTLFPNNDNIRQRENAMSVAEGIAQPLNVDRVINIYKYTYTKAGTNIPPTAPIIGK